MQLFLHDPLCKQVTIWVFKFLPYNRKHYVGGVTSYSLWGIHSFIIMQHEGDEFTGTLIVICHKTLLVL